MVNSEQNLIITREYPNHLVHVSAGPGDAQPPAALHPVFSGGFDGHAHLATDHMGEHWSSGFALLAIDEV